MSSINIPLSSVSKYITVDVRLKGVKRWTFRCWLGVQLLKLAAWILPVKTYIEVERG